MENKNNETISLLNELIRTNNDRIEGYERAIDDTEDNQLKSLFHTMAQESRQFKNELLTEVIKLGGTPEEGTTATGKVFRAWMDFKSAIAGKSRKAIITSCELGEEAAIGVYHHVMNSGKLPAQYVSIVSRQQGTLQRSHNRIKLMGETIKSL